MVDLLRAKMLLILLSTYLIASYGNDHAALRAWEDFEDSACPTKETSFKTRRTGALIGPIWLLDTVLLLSRAFG